MKYKLFIIFIITFLLIVGCSKHEDNERDDKISTGLTYYTFNPMKEWIEFYGSPIEIMDNQWICTFDCKYKYTGIFSGIGEMNIL